MDTPTLIGTGFALLGLVLWILCAYLAYRQAPRFGRRPIPWLVIGIVFGPIALMVLYILPKGSQPQHGARKSSDPRADLYEVPRKKG
jgi:hypothetical protein